MSKDECAYSHSSMASTARLTLLSTCVCVQVLLLEQGTDVKAAFSCDNNLTVHSIAPYSKGFVAGQVRARGGNDEGDNEG